MTDLPFPDLPPTHPANRVDPRLLRFNDSDFSPKLNFGERCSVAALQLMGINSVQVALAYGINRRTATRMMQKDKYRTIQDEINRLGKADFIATYCTEDALKRVESMANHPNMTLQKRDEEATPKGVRAGIPNKRAGAQAGISVHKAVGAPYSQRIEVKWGKFHEDAPEGWWARCLDMDDMLDVWFGDPDKDTHLTSAAALRHAKTWLDEQYG